MECLKGHRLAEATNLVSYVESLDVEHLAWKPEKAEELKKTLTFRGQGAEMQLLCAEVSP